MTTLPDNELAKKYDAFLGAIGVMALCFLVFLFASAGLNRFNFLSKFQVLIYFSSVTLGFITAFSGLLYSAKPPEFLIKDAMLLLRKKEDYSTKFKGKVVLTLFILYTFALVLVIVLDGGVASPFTNLLVLNSGFGIYFAIHIRTKYLIMGITAIAYFLASFKFVLVEDTNMYKLIYSLDYLGLFILIFVVLITYYLSTKTS